MGHGELRDIFQTSPETSLTHRKIAEMGGKSATKAAYFDKLKSLLETYKSIFIVTVDNVSSQQMHEIRLPGATLVCTGASLPLAPLDSILFIVDCVSGLTVNIVDPPLHRIGCCSFWVFAPPAVAGWGAVLGCRGECRVSLPQLAYG